jgi:hypothetical protein
MKKVDPLPLDFLTTLSTPLKKFGQNPKDPHPPGFPTTVHLCLQLKILTPNKHVNNAISESYLS